MSTTEATPAPIEATPAPTPDVDDRGEPSVRNLQGQYAAARRWNKPNRDELARDYAAAKLADYIARTVDAAPPLTDAQRDRLALLLRAGGHDG